MKSKWAFGTYKFYQIKNLNHTVYYRYLIVILFIVITRCIMIGNNPNGLKITWLIFTTLLIIITDRITVLWCFVALFVLFPSTGWYIGGNFGQLFRYNFLLDNEIYNFKPNEIYILLFSFKVFMERKKLTIPKSNINKSFIFLFVSMIFGIVVGIGNEHPIRSFFLASEFRILMEGFLFFYTAWYCINDEKSLNETIDIFIVLSVLKSIIALLEYHLMIPNIFYTSGYSIATYSSIISGINDLNIIVFSILLILSKFVFVDYLKKNVFKKIITISLLLFMVLIVIFSFRRTSYVMVLVGFLWIFYKMDYKQLLIFFILVIPLTTTSYFIMNSDYFKNSDLFEFIKMRFDISKNLDQYDQVLESNESHIRDLQLGFKLVKDNPILGKGVGSRFIADRSIVYETTLIHNGLFHSWVKFGIFGAISYLFFYYYSFKSIYNKGSIIKRNKWILTGCFAFIVANLFSEFFMSPFFQNFQKTSLIFFALCISERVLFFGTRILINNNSHYHYRT